MINIAIDGFCGSGKSTLAKELANKLGFNILDTGAIFRGFGYAYSKQNLGEMTDKKVNKFLENVTVTIKFIDGKQNVFVGAENVTDFLRDEKVGQLASQISVFPKVREAYLSIAQKFAKENDCLMEGRDIGTIVMPNADLKIFLTANANVRAKRRFDELVAKGESVLFENVLADLKERDLRDTTRLIAPLVPTQDSIVVDNTDMDFAETVDFCLKLINQKIGDAKSINIAIDGYVCSGKSTIARALAKRLDFKVFDTGALYRGVACAFDYMKLDENKICDDYIQKFSDQINVKVDFIDGLEHVFVNGIDYTAHLRTERASTLSAKISPFVCIREKVLNLQRSYARENNLVMEGRDIGSFVLPNADFKFFCTADESVRAKRRFEQQLALGNDVKFADILRELKERDYKDIHRDHGAIKVCPDSIIVDTTHQSLEQSVKFCLKEIRKKYPNIKTF